MTTASFKPVEGWILCRDQRLCRLLENELGYLGLTAVVYASLPSPSQDVSLLLWDGDEFPAAEGISLANACGCPLMVFGRGAVEMNPPTNASESQRTYLRRPFALSELEKTIQALLHHLPLPGSPIAPPLPLAKAPAPPVLTARDGTVTIGEHTVTLTFTEWIIFEYLYERRGEPVPRAELSTLLGGGGNSVDVYVCHLRTKIEKPLGKRMIWTVRGVGYRMDHLQP